MTLPRTIASLLLAAPVFAAAPQEQDGHLARLPLLSQAFAEQSQPLRLVDDELERVHSMIERLEVGMSALAEAGADELLHEVQRLTIELRNKAEVMAAERAHAERGGDSWGDLDSLEFRLEILRWSLKAYMESGDTEAAKYLERCLHVGELQLHGAGEEEMAQAMEGIDMGHLIEMLHHSARLWMSFGDEHRAHHCLKLAEFYAWRMGGGEVAEMDEPAEEVEPDRHWGDLNERPARLELLALSAHVLERGGMMEQAHHMHQMVRYGKMQEHGGSEEEMAEVAATLSMEAMFHGIEAAAELLQEWGEDTQAHRLRSLLHFYYERDGLQGSGEDEHASEPPSEPEREPEGEPREFDLENKELRLKLLAGASRVLARDGHERASEYLQRFVSLGKLQLSGATDDQVMEASEGLTMDGAHECLALAAQILSEGGHSERASAIYLLREFYYERDGNAAPEHGADEAEAQDAADLDFEDLKTRIQVVGGAVRILHRGGRTELAQYLQRFADLGRLQLEGAGQEDLLAASEGLSMEGMHEGLAIAAALAEEWGAGKRAHGFNGLREYYNRRDGVEDHNEDESPLDREHYDLEQRSERLLIVEMGIDAHREAGNEDWVNVMGRFYRYGQMQEAGASDEELSEHAQGLTMDDAIEGLAAASKLYAEWGWEGRAHWCAALSSHYYEQTYGSEEDDESAEAVLWEIEQAVASEAVPTWNATLEERDDTRRHLDEVYSEMDRLYVQMAELQARIEKLQSMLDR